MCQGNISIEPRNFETRSPTIPCEINIVLNRFEELKERIPAPQKRKLPRRLCGWHLFPIPDIHSFHLTLSSILEILSYNAVSGESWGIRFSEMRGHAHFTGELVNTMFSDSRRSFCIHVQEDLNTSAEHLCYAAASGLGPD